MEQNLCRLLHLVSCMSLSTQLLALVHLLSRHYTPACLSMSSPKHNCYLSYNRCAHSGCHSWLSFITVIIQAHPSLLSEHQVVRKSYTPHAACGYRIKLQHQEYTEQRVTDIYIYMWQSRIETEYYFAAYFEHITEFDAL